MLTFARLFFSVALLLAGVGLGWASNGGRTLVVGSEEEYPPFSTGLSGDAAGGFTVDLWKAVAKESRLNYTIRVLPFNQILQEFKDGKIDVLINLAQSEQRRQFASFTVPHVTVNGAIFERKGMSGILAESDLARKSIIVLKADLAHDYAISKGWQKQLVVADTVADCFKLLAAGKHDAVLISKLVGLQTLRALKLDDIQPLDIKAGFSQKFSFAVHKDDPDLLATINESFSLVKLNGTYDDLHEKWFGIYEDKVPSLRDVLRYLWPLIFLFLFILGFIFHKRKIELALRESNESLERRVALRTRELEEARNAADLSNRAKGDFLANMSHEIRTPMNAIIGTLHLALKAEMTSKQRTYLERIQASSKHLLGIVNDILDFSKIDAGKLDLELINFDLADILQNIVDQVSWKSNEKGLTLKLEIDSRLPRYLRGDPLRLTQVLINFTNNAIKFTKAGEIIVRAREMEAGKSDSLIRFEVQDSGVGMSVEEQAKLFQSFQQADSSTTRKYGGTGLGLAISKQLVMLMGGEVGVASQAGQGSIFWFAIRLDFGRAPLDLASVSAPPPAPLWLNGARILLVEDNLFNQQVAIDLLEDVGAAVIVAGDGWAALDHLHQENFDCVLMDIQMPEMDGFEAVQRIRAVPSEVPVIAMTANARREDREHCLAAGMNDFVGKPIDPATFYAVLKKWLPRSGSHQATHSGKRAVDFPLDPARASRRELAGLPRSDPDVIDVSVLAKACENNPKRIERYASVFLESVRIGMVEIDAALEGADRAALRALGHRLKSSAKAAGAMGLAELCLSLEKTSDDDSLELIRERIARFRPLIEKIKEQLETSFGTQ